MRFHTKVWFDKNVKHIYLRVFGCKTFGHVPKAERSKLDAKYHHCIFIGYGQDDFGYRLYDHERKMLIRSMDFV